MVFSRRMTLAAAIILAALTVHAEDGASFTSPPPAIYKEKLAKLLTPLDTVLQHAADAKDLSGDGIVLLDEEVTWVGPDGRRILVYHTVDKALTDAGVKSMAQDSFSYKKKMQRVRLVSAQTIQPDGRRLKVQSDAVFMKMPQDEADDSVYNDESEMVTVYSDVKVGSITENITVLEDTESRIPNEFSQTYTWNESWPEYRQRWIVNLPKSYADRLTISNIGAGVPDHAAADAGDGRQQLTWEKLNTPADEEMNSDPPSTQVGPIVWLSTQKDWDAFAAWYSSLCKGTDKLGPELKAKIDAWTKDAKDPADIVRILYSHAAQDVRYTAFELGKSDLQPHDCMSVWGRQYGDCKDKANLLRAMLAYKGVPSWLTLLCTEHAGVINKANPDYRQFDHCILYAQTGGSFVICDPTITYGTPGLLNGAETDRDVLVVKGDKADWVHVPPFHDAKTTYTFDLQLRPSGELAGWMELKADGYYSTFYRNKFADLTKDQVRSDLQDDVQSFFPNASVVDVETPKAPSTDANAAAPAPYSIRAYMVLTGVLNSSENTSELKFPAPALLLPDTTDYKSRQHATFTWPDQQVMSCKIHLPPGWQAPSLPLPLTYQSPTLDYSTSWTADKDVLSADCQVQVKQALFAADAFRTLGDALTNLSSWSSKSLALEKSSSPSTPTPPAQTDADLAANLPVMPTGEGQLNLIDSEFPDDGNLVARRAALERIPTLFPADAKSVMEAGIKIAVLDLDNNKWDDVLQRLQPLEAAHRAALDADTIAWSDYIIALALAGQNKKAEALALYKKIADNTDVADGRRGWSIYQAARIMADTASTQAALEYTEKGLTLTGDAEPDLFGFYAATAIQNGGSDRLKDRLKKVIAAKPDNLEDILLQTSTSAQDLIESDHRKEGLALVTLLEGLSDPATTGDAFSRALKKVRDGADATDKYAAIQQALKQALAASPDIAALEKAQPAFASIDDAKKSMGQHDSNSEAGAALGCSLRMLTGYPVDSNFPEYLWNCAQYSEWELRQKPGPVQDAFFFKLSEIADQLPHSNDDYAEIKILTGEVLEAKGRRPDAAAVYTAMEKQSDLPEGFIGPVAYYGGNNCAEQGDYAGALGFYKFGESAVDTQARAQESVLRAAFINFDDGNQAEASRLVNLLASAVQKKKLTPAEQISNVVDMATNSNTPPAYWSNWQAWWPQWQRIETAMGVPPVKGKEIPVIASLADLGKSLGEAKNSKDTVQFFQIMRQVAYAARFYQNAAFELIGTFNVADEVVPDRANDFRLLAISMLEPMAPTEAKDQRMRYLYLLINYFDSNQGPKAIDLMKSWDGKLEDGGKYCAGIHRVWALAAIQQKQDLDKVAPLLEKDVKTTTGSDRGLTTGILSDLYVAQGRTPDAIHLLETEIADPEIASDSSSVQDLKTRLDNIQKVSETTKLLANGVESWLKDHKPAWWDYAEPKSADDPRMARLGDILKQNDNSLEPAELVKAGLLAPSSSTLGADTQRDGVLNSFRTLLGMAPTQTDADALAHSILDNTSFPDSLKSTFLYYFLIDAYNLQKPASFETFRKVPLYATLADSEKRVIEKLALFLNVDRTSSSALTAALAPITKGPVSELDFGLVEDTVTYLLQLGDIPSAQAIYQASSSYTFATDVKTSRPEMQLTLLRPINAAKELQAALEALRKTVLAAHPPDSITKPVGFDDRRNYSDLEDLSYEQATAIRLYLIKIHQAPPSLSFWYEFMFDLPHDSTNADLCLALIKAGLDNTVDDETKAFQVSYGSGVLDIDNSAVRDKFTALIQPYRDPGKFPQTTECIRLFDASTNLRLGKPVNLDVDLGGFTASENIHDAARYKLRAYRQANDQSRLKAVLNSLSADDLVSPSMVSATLPALEAAGLQDEATLARDYLSRKLYHDVLSCWFNPTGRSMRTVTDDVDGLQTAKDIPDTFTSFTQDHVQRKREALSFRITKASTEQKWDAVAQASEDLLHDYPTYYSFYWPLGRSLAELGHKDEAVKALDIYCRYSLDEAEYPKAKTLLAELAPPKT
jgi:tetratricopeptide (TPR) repeat protein/transglutaminase-like putative cysteine protease